ncbi:MAG: single-stranded-DNA-specific exonuclease RecJ [Ruminococcaceae bacterium]|nr:single-stranded-DNA-specific exonuclease RecJ [Oscillospiraceae bacterium]
MQKKWNILGERNAATEALARDLGIGTLAAGLLCNRGYTTREAAERFIHMEEELLHSPMLLRDMDKAVERIKAAIESGERIVIYGDYDVDGVTSVTILYLFLAEKGADVGYYIPNRMGEGYGMSEGSLDHLIDDGANLIVTVDTGITANAEVAHAASRGTDVVVTDHHECHGDLPNAVAVVNPRRADCEYPFKELAGVGVVFKLLCAFEASYENISEQEAVRRICENYADLVAIGTIADVMPIKDENRLIVAYGLNKIEKSERMGLCALCEAVSRKPDGKAASRAPKITSSFVGYTLAPRINAAGRISSASLAVELFLTSSREKADELAARLCDINRERQSEENRIALEAYAKIEASHNFDRDPVIVLEADSWHHGVIGIVASRITEKYGLPSILISFDGAQSDGNIDIGKGSGRSVKGLNLVDALVHCGDLLEKYGGHELAAGLSVRRENIDAFREKINAYARENFSYDDLVPTLDADFEIGGEEVNIQNADELRILEPYGVSNPVPSFVLRNMRVSDVQSISFGKHTKILLERRGMPSLTAMYFSRAPKDADVYIGDTVDVFATMDINEFGGQRTAQLIVRDIRICESEAEKYRELKERFGEIWQGGAISADEDVIPARDDFATVYNFIRRRLRFGEDVFTVREMLLREEPLSSIGYIKLRFIINVMLEMNIIGVEEIGEDKFSFKLHYQNKHTDLEKSALLKRLRTQQRKA